ncbi:hypothetical protein ACHAXT_010654 [Thalassiosira profunda]
MDDDDDDTVVGTCLHCNAPPPPRGGGGSSYAGGGGGGGGGPCSAGSTLATTASATSTTPSAATRVQVSCDDCRSFICDGCHWCHEFQANHEIRVCDRCDAFYCRGCDEMDQCEDCSEVVCNTCSTLMSCKFCGCGLCEDCATACGRCGIVLCARDAKFAVECDTCRMSYCLVCLASGTKDPCVRCGHRPSKRVEQLVHLRLKSIYKAFKQSGASSGPGSGSGGGSGSSGGCKGDGSGRDPSSKYSSALRSLSDTASDSSKDSFSNFDQSMASEVAAVLQTASNSMAGRDGGDYADGPRRSGGKRVSSHSTSRASGAAAERYFRQTQAEREAAAAAAEAEAEAAAEALLAELDEEKASSTGASKKSKKKKKKKEQKRKEDATYQPALESFAASDDLKSKKKGSTKPPPKSHLDDESSDEEMNFEQLIAGAKGSSKPSTREKKEENGEEAKLTAPTPETQTPIVEVAASATSEATTADFDAELAILLSNEDEDGLQTFLANLKGVPGLGAARKTAKKALKRMKEEREAAVPAEPESKPQATSGGTAKYYSTAVEAAARSTAQKASGTQHMPLLRVVSRTQSSAGGSSGRGGSSSTAIPASARAECVMHMSPSVVGWVIGKGGSRIRDMMQESEAKIWIDQESMGPKEPRVVYVSGKRANVDTAVRMVKDLVAKAPVAASAAASQGAASAASTAKSAPAPAPSVPKPATAKPSKEMATKKEPASFAAAIASGTSSGASTPAATVTPPGPNPVVSTKQPAVKQLPTASGSAPAPTQAAPQSVMPAPPQLAQIPPKQPGFGALEDPGAAKLFSDTVTSELTIDPRFVALLIGRHGWTAKNIQTESGANLRIDQSIDPPKIVISGGAENVNKAKQLVCEVLKYPQAQIQKEVPPPAAATSLHRDVSSSSTPSLMDDRHLQPNPTHPTHVAHASEGAMNLPPGYSNQQQNQRGLGIFPDSSPTASKIAEFLPNHSQRQLPAAPMNSATARAQSQDWGGHQGQEAPMRGQYSTLPPFTGNQNLPSNANSPPSFVRQSSSHEDSHRRASATAYDQHRQFQQNIEPAHRMPQPHAQVPPAPRMNDFVGSAGGLGQNMNGWDAPPNRAPVGGSWNQGQQVSQQPGFQARVPPTPQPSFQTQATSPQQLSNNPFAASSQPPGLNRVSDDSLMVDNMFASLGTTGSGDDGLLDALNSVSLGGGGGEAGAAPSQQGNNNLGSMIAGWTGDSSSANSFMQQSRLGDFGK